MTAVDKWLSTATAQAARHGVELHVLDDDGYVLTRGHYTQRCATREAVAAVLRLAGIAVADPPQESAL